MIKNDYIIRLEEEKDYKETENLVREAFWNVYRPGCLEHYLVHIARTDKDYVKDLAFVMEHEGKLIAQIMFVKSQIICDNGSMLPTLTMGPISIHPDYKRQGLGTFFLNYCLQQAKDLGFGAVLIEGNYEFYKHCGFTYSRDFNIRYKDLPMGVDDSFFLCCELKEGYLNGISGEYSDPEVYMFNPEDAEEFDETFPQKEKLILPGQLG